MSRIDVSLTPKQIEYVVSGLSVQAKNLQGLIQTFTNSGSNPVVDEFVAELQDIKTLRSKLSNLIS
ncbi:hypothetical protein [Neptunicella sp. SCSIO 80796]|uniref:hypothetical protein n=1 Tax=Neptunicella plasticusilytica TaxID=3117012 RepID=UPI003A4DCFE9